MDRLFEGLLELDSGVPPSLADAPLKVLADWFLSDAEGKNLQPKTLKFYRLKLRYLLEVLGDRKPADISTQHLRLLLNHLKETRDWSIQNVNHAIQVWKGLFYYLEREGIIDTNPARRLQKLRQEKRFPKPFTLEEIRRIFAATKDDFCGVRDRTMMVVLLDTGIRLGELMGIKTEDVDLGHGVLRVFGKGRKERFVPFQSTVRRMLLKYLALRSAQGRAESAYEDALWVTISGTPLSAVQFHKLLEGYAVKSGVPGVHAHRFRHTFATEYLKNGGSPQMLQQILGHTTPMMVQRYVHISDRDAKDNHRLASPVEAWNIGNRRR